MKPTAIAELRQRLARLEAKERLLAAPPAKVRAQSRSSARGLPHNTLDARSRGSLAMARHRTVPRAWLFWMARARTR